MDHRCTSRLIWKHIPPHHSSRVRSYCKILAFHLYSWRRPASSAQCKCSPIIILCCLLTSLSSAEQSNIKISPRIPRLIRLLLIVALALAIKAGTDTSASEQSQDVTFKKVSIILFLVIYVALVAQHAYLWLNRNAILRVRRTVSLSSSPPSSGTCLSTAPLSSY